MPRPRKDLSAHREQIIEWLASGMTREDVVKQLEERYNLKIALSTLKRSLTEWNVPTHRPAYHKQDEAALRAAITDIFNEDRLTDKEAAERLNREGFQVTMFTVGRLRRGMGLTKRLTTANLEDIDDEVMRMRELAKEQGEGVLGGMAATVHERVFRGKEGEVRVEGVETVEVGRGPLSALEAGIIAAAASNAGEE